VWTNRSSTPVWTLCSRILKSELKRLMTRVDNALGVAPADEYGWGGRIIRPGTNPFGAAPPGVKPTNI
jgi:hypothetical protein